MCEEIGGGSGGREEGWTHTIGMGWREEMIHRLSY